MLALCDDLPRIMDLHMSIRVSALSKSLGLPSPEQGARSQ